jgi:Tol biopolymer transport system component
LGLVLACGCAPAAPAPAPGPPAPASPDAASARPRAAPPPPVPGERHLRNLRQLTFGGNNAEAYFSRSGEQLIFQRQEQVSAGCDQQYVMNVDGTGLHRVSNGRGRTTCGYFYDGDRRVLFSSTHGASPACPAPPDRSHGYVWPLNDLEIYTAKPDGTDLQQLTRFGTYTAEATLSPDGSRIVFTSTKDGDLELYTMRADGTDVHRVTHRVGYDGGAFFSPDGKSLVWRAWYPETARDTAEYLDLLHRKLVRPSRMELWMADADGGGARQLTRLGGANFAPFFTPDGRHIIFSSNFRNPRSRNFDLYLVGVDGSGVERITFDPEFDGFPVFSPDGRRLVWSSNRNAQVMGETNLFIADWVP